jgi:hypothetical protein
LNTPRFVPPASNSGEGWQYIFFLPPLADGTRVGIGFEAIHFEYVPCRVSSTSNSNLSECDSLLENVVNVTSKMPHPNLQGTAIGRQLAFRQDATTSSAKHVQHGAAVISVHFTE